MIARLLSLIAVTMLCAVQVATAQTRPKLTDVGIEGPKSSIFIGNSFFYYNNGMPGHLTLLEKAADPEHKADYRATMATIGASRTGSRTSSLPRISPV